MSERKITQQTVIKFNVIDGSGLVQENRSIKITKLALFLQTLQHISGASFEITDLTGQRLSIEEAAKRFDSELSLDDIHKHLQDINIVINQFGVYEFRGAILRPRDSFGDQTTDEAAA
jgi:hypothetical protein